MPETDPKAYEALVYAGFHEDAITNLTELLHHVRQTPMIGLWINELRTVCFEPFGGPDLFNRKVSLLLSEIEANQSRWRKPVDEKKFNREYQLSGLTRP